MKKILVFSLLIALFMGVAHQDAFAQSKKKKKSSKTDEYFDDSGNLKDKLWYGGGFGLGFQQTRFGGAPGNLFNFGLSPMVGYKFNNWLSAGPRLDLNWVTGRFQISQGAPVIKYNAIDYGVGPFIRAKPINNIFLHGEYMLNSQNFTTGFVNANNRLETVRQWTDALNIGAGYTSGGLIQTEISILYNVLDEGTTTNIPISFRFALTYNF